MGGWARIPDPGSSQKKKKDFNFPFSGPINIKFPILEIAYKFFKKEKSPNTKTVCVGNIYLGGTGKTPLSIRIYQILKKLNNSAAIIKKMTKYM